MHALSLLVVLSICSTLTLSANAADGQTLPYQPTPVRAASQPTGASVNASAIANGYDSDAATARYMAHIASTFAARETRLCSATVLTDRLVLTAAHCVTHETAALTAVRVWVGGTGLWAGRSYAAAAALVHPRYDRRASLNDVAVVAVAAPFASGTFATVVLGRRRRDATVESLLYASGYGAVAVDTDTGAPVLAGRLQTTVLRVESVRACRAFFVHEFADTLSVRHAICATDPRFPYNGLTGVCAGDSGGPLYSKLPGGRVKVVGVLSARTPGSCPEIAQVAVYFNMRSAARLIGAVAAGDTTVMNDVLGRA